jgi:hypothetical protein
MDQFGQRSFFDNTECTEVRIARAAQFQRNLRGLSLIQTNPSRLQVLFISGHQTDYLLALLPTLSKFRKEDRFTQGVPFQFFYINAFIRRMNQAGRLFNANQH